MLNDGAKALRNVAWLAGQSIFQKSIPLSLAKRHKIAI